MNEHSPLDPTVDIPPGSDNVDAGLAAAFEPDSGPPLPAGGSILHALSAGLSSVPRILLREPESFGGSPIVLSSEEMPNKQDPAARLQLHGEIARGGMGAVLKGRDVDLGRDVAVKVLLETHQGKSEMLQRFVEEAQISGQLQHPGIAPLYELGQLPDRRPYFTMKLVKGKTLATLLAARKSPDEERTRHIGIFAQVCQTLAYAHARGVIHRDLKPSNVMVGAFGEVQVMDWGLAKVLKEGGIADELKAQQRPDVSVIRTQRSEGSSSPDAGSHTQAGTMLGTPAYMAPEQARGEVELVDERADVFGLGGILCEILTGKPPYSGKGADLQHKARNAKLDDAFARLDSCGADAELIILAKHCLALEPWERPHHAGEVAEQVTAYQQSVTERLRQAELAETEARARAEEESKTREQAQARLAAERRARRLTRSLAAAVLLAFSLAGGGGLFYQRHVTAQREETARRQAELREAVTAALDKVTDLRQRARWAEARAVLEQVRQRLGASGPEDLRNEVTQAEKDLQLVDRLDAARLKASVWVDSHFDHASAVREYEVAFREAGIGEATEAAEVVAERIRASAVREPLVAALDDWALLVGKKEQAQRAWLLAVARAADPDSWRDRFRDAALWENRAALERLAGEAKTSELLPQTLSALAILLRRGSADAVPLLTAAQRRYPNDFWMNFYLGTALGEVKRYEEAISYYRAALAVRPASTAAYNNLGLVLKDVGRPDDAIAAYNKAIELDPRFAYAHNGLGLALRHKGRLDEAIAEYKKAIESDPKYAHPYCNLGNALHDQGRLDEAIVEHKKAMELDPKLVQAHNGLGRALQNKGRIDEAIAEFQKAIKLDPTFALAHKYLGDALADKSRLDEALAEYKKCVELDPDYVTPHNLLGNHLREKGRLDEAVTAFLRGIELDPKLPRLHSSLGRILCDHKDDYDGAIAAFRKAIELDPKDAVAHHNLGVALLHKGRLDEAIAEYKKAIELDPKYAKAHYNLGEALAKKGQLDEAIAEYKKAIELDPKDVEARNSLADVFVRQGRRDEAILLFKKAIELDPKDVSAYNSLGIALWRKGQVDEAVAECRKAIELDPKSANAHNSLGGILWEAKHDYDGAIAAFRKAIELDPKYASAHSNLGAILCDGKHDYDGAIAQFRKAIELDDKDAAAHLNLGNALYGKGRLDEAIAEYKRAIKLDPKVAKPHYCLGVILADKGRLDESIAEYRKAIELDPKNAQTHSRLGQALFEKDRLDEAIAELKKVIELDPTNASAHSNLGAMLCDGKLDYDGAIAAFRKAIELDPKYATAYSNLGMAQLNKGQLDEALADWRKALELDPKDAKARNALASWEPIAALQSKLPAILEGKLQPRDNAERLRLAQLCAHKKYHRGAAQLYADAFAAEPKLADDQQAEHRYSAACYAALSAAGQGADAAKLDAKERARWRKQALDWLRADLNTYGKLLVGGKAEDRKLVRERLQHWQRDADLTCIRDARELAKLPPGERQTCEKLWTDVAALLKKIEAPK